jgi:acetolactate synthase-1/2/3 large subunit
MALPLRTVPNASRRGMGRWPRLRLLGFPLALAALLQGCYDMVAFQENAHYGRTAGVELGDYDIVGFAEAFGCKGYRIANADQLGPVLREALQQEVPVLIDIPIDYSQNFKLMQDVHQDFVH